MNGWLIPAATLWKREIVTYARDRSRVIGGVVPPIIFWVFIGSGFGGTYRAGADGSIPYLHYFFPGILTLIFLFTAVFSSMSIIEDRREGFLQSVLTAPVPRFAIVAGKVMGSATLAIFQGIPFIIIGLVVGIRPELGSIVKMVLILFGASFSLACIGFIIAWRLNSTQGFHAVMNMFLMPLWLLSGAMFPLAGLPGWLDFLVDLNPLTYTVAALQQVLFAPEAVAGLPSSAFCATVNVLFCIAAFFAAVTAASVSDRKG